jgi:hypothetical protein
MVPASTRCLPDVVEAGLWHAPVAMVSSADLTLWPAGAAKWALSAS